MNFTHFSSFLQHSVYSTSPTVFEDSINSMYIEKPYTYLFYVPKMFTNLTITGIETVLF